MARCSSDCEKKFAYGFMHSGTLFFCFCFIDLEAEFVCVLSVSFSGILSVNLMRMMMNTAVLHVKGFAIVLFVVVNGVKHTLEPVDATNIIHHHQHNALFVSSLVPKRTYHHYIVIIQGEDQDYDDSGGSYECLGFFV